MLFFCPATVSYQLEKGSNEAYSFVDRPYDEKLTFVINDGKSI